MPGTMTGSSPLADGDDAIAFDRKQWQALMRAFGLVLAVLGLLAASLPAALADENFGLWSAFIIKKELVDELSGNVEVQGRTAIDSGNGQTLLLRSWLDYQLKAPFQISAGYDQFERFKDGSHAESRPWQQFNFDTEPFKNFPLSHRFRLEERFIQGVDGVSLRLRYLIGGQQWIDEDHRWLAFASNEIFFNVNDVNGGAQKGFNQNRVQGGFGYQLTGATRVKAAYQWQQRRSKESQHQLLLTFSLDLDRLGGDE